MRDLEVLSLDVEVSSDIALVQFIKDLNKCINLRKLRLEFSLMAQLRVFERFGTNLITTIERSKLNFIFHTIDYSFDCAFLRPSSSEEVDSNEFKCKVCPNVASHSPDGENDLNDSECENNPLLFASDRDESEFCKINFPDDKSFYDNLYYSIEKN